MAGAPVALVSARSDSAAGGDAPIAVVSLVVLLVAVASGWSPLVAVAVALAGGAYAEQLAADDARLDTATPLVAAGLLVAAELAYWSLEERERAPGDPGQGARRLAFVAALGIGALVVSALLLALVDAVHVRSLALDVAGAFAAATALTVIVVVARGRGSQDR